MRKVLVTGAGGFIGHHLVERLKEEGNFVVGVDLKRPAFEGTAADIFRICDLRDSQAVDSLFTQHNIDDVYHLAADMGGIGYIGRSKFGVASGNAIMDSLMLIASQRSVERFFFSSSACVYPQRLQQFPGETELEEGEAWPADPERGYGLEKLFMEELCDYATEETGFKTRVARFHNIYGPMGTYTGGKEKAPAAICRKVAMASNPGEIEVWGDGTQRRSFTYIDDCIEGIRRLMESNWTEPLNIGSDEAVTICELVEIVAWAARKKISIKYIPTEPTGVLNRNSNNDRIKQVLNWAPETLLTAGICETYDWIAKQVVPVANNV